MVERVLNIVETILKELKSQGVMGLIQGPDTWSTAYFGHFHTLLHLEYLDEVQMLKNPAVTSLSACALYGHVLCS